MKANRNIGVPPLQRENDPRSIVRSKILHYQNDMLNQSKGFVIVVPISELVYYFDFDHHNIIYHRTYFIGLTEERCVRYTENNPNSGLILICYDNIHPCMLKFLSEFLKESHNFYGSIIPEIYYESFINFLVDTLGLCPNHPYNISNQKLKELLNAKLQSIYGKANQKSCGSVSSRRKKAKKAKKAKKEKNPRPLLIDADVMVLERTQTFFEGSGMCPEYLLVKSNVAFGAFKFTYKLNVVILTHNCNSVSNSGFEGSGFKYLVHKEGIQFEHRAFALCSKMITFFTLEQCGVENTDHDMLIANKVHLFIKTFESKKKEREEKLSACAHSSDDESDYTLDEQGSNDGFDDDSIPSLEDGDHEHDEDANFDRYQEDGEEDGGDDGNDDGDNDNIPSLIDMNIEYPCLLLNDEVSVPSLSLCKKKTVSCLICFDQNLDPEVCLCYNCEQHGMICIGCVNDMVISQTIDKTSFQGKIVCSMCNTNIDDHELFKFLNKETIALYLRAICNTASENTAMLLRKENDDNIEKIHQDIFQLILNPKMDGMFPLLLTQIQTALHAVTKCPNPNCTMQIHDWDACFAVECSAKDINGITHGCGIRFCGWCLGSFGTDNFRCHEHVKSCIENTKYRGTFYGTIEEVMEVRKKKYRETVIKFIRDNINEHNLRLYCLRYIQQELENWGVVLTENDILFKDTGLTGL